MLKNDLTIFNLQKLKVSDTVFPATSHGKFAVVHTTDNIYCLCQLFLSSTLHSSFCNVDLSVCGYSSIEGSKKYPAKKPPEKISVSSVEVLPSIEHLKSVSLVVVFNTPTEAKHWKHKPSQLGDLTKNILKLFVLKRNCVVNLDGIKELFDTQLNCFLVESTGNIEVGKVVNSTKIKISSIISSITYKQVYANNGDFETLGGLEEPTKNLKEIMKCVGIKVSDDFTMYKQVCYSF